MRNVTVAAVQMKCSKSVEKNIAHAEELVRQAAAKGAEIVLLPELFERPYFCQELTGTDRIAVTDFPWSDTYLVCHHIQ